MPRILELDDIFQGRATTSRYSNEGTIEDSLTKADVVIGAVLVPGANAPCLVTREMLSLMQHRAVLVDVAIDQGGCFETSKPTTHQDPTFLVDYHNPLLCSKHAWCSAAYIKLRP